MNWKKFFRSHLGLLTIITGCHILILALVIGCSSTPEKEEIPQEIMLEVSLGNLPDTAEPSDITDPGNLPPQKPEEPAADPQIEEQKALQEEQRKIAEEKQKQQELEEKKRKEAEARQKKELAEKKRKEAEAKRKKELAEKKRKEAEAKRKKELAEKKKQKELAEKQRRDAEAKRKRELAEKQRRDAEAKRKRELAEKQRRDAEAKRKRENSGVYQPSGQSNFDPSKPLSLPKGQPGNGGTQGNGQNNYGQMLYQPIRDTWQVPSGIWVTEGNAATIEIIIDKNGRVTSGRIIARSPNLQINQSVERLIADLKKKKLPPPPGNRSAKLVFKMVSD